MVELFAVGTFWFWALIVAEIGLLLIFSEFENGIGATISFAAFIGLLQFCGNANPLHYMLSHWYGVIVVLGVSLLLGFLWATYMWRRFVRLRDGEHHEMLANFVRDKKLSEGTTVLPMEFRKEWCDRVNRTRDSKTGRTIAEVPLVRHHKAKVMRWWLMWPFSAAMYLFKDLVADCFRALWKKAAYFFQKMANDIWSRSKISENLNVPEEPTTGGSQG